MPDAPTIVGARYRLGRLLAASGMADVYAATDERLDRPVALKFLRAAGPTDHERFRREMATVARFEHPNLVRLYDADVHDATPYLVLELVDGPSLAEHLATDGSLDSDRAGHLLRDLASALAYVHAHDVVHRDVKPSNVLLDPDGRARLTDFGIARAGDATAMTGTAMTIGTAAYLAPEQAAGGAVTSAADVYALGLVALECLTGERAFPGPPVEAAVARLSRDPEIPATLGVQWCELLRQMTARDPDARPTAASIAARATDEAAGVADGTSTVPMAVAVSTATVPVGVTEGSATVPIGAADTSTVAMDEAPTATKLQSPVASDEPEPPRRRPWRVGALLALVALIVLVAIGLATGFGSDDSPLDAQPNGSTVATSLPPTTTTPTTTAPPTTAAPAVVAASSCATLEADRRALDQQKKALGGKGTDKTTQDAQRRALDDKKKQLDAALKACRED